MSVGKATAKTSNEQALEAIDVTNLKTALALQNVTNTSDAQKVASGPIKDYIDETKHEGNTLENLTATGAIDIDLAQFDTVKLNFTDNGSVTFSNLPTIGKTKTCTIIITTQDGSQTVGLPTTSEYNYYGEIDTTKRNLLKCKFSFFETSGLEADIEIDQPRLEGTPAEALILSSGEIVLLNSGEAPLLNTNI